MEFTPSDDPCPALTRGLILLKKLGNLGPASLERLAQLTGWPKSSVFRLLATLEAAGVVERDKTDRRYRAAMRLVPFAPVIDDLRPRMQAKMKELCEHANQTAELFVWYGGELTMIDRAEPEGREVAVRARIGWRPDTTEIFSLTLASLAWASLGTIDRKVRHWQWKLSERLAVSTADVQTLVAETREQGIAICSYPNIHGVRRYVVPVWDSSKHLSHVLAIAAVPAPQQGPEYERLRRLALDAGATLSRLTAAQAAS